MFAIRAEGSVFVVPFVLVGMLLAQATASRNSLARSMNSSPLAPAAEAERHRWAVEADPELHGLEELLPVSDMEAHPDH